MWIYCGVTDSGTMSRPRGPPQVGRSKVLRYRKKKADKFSLIGAACTGKASRPGSRRSTISFLFFFLLQLLSHLALKLMKALNLIRRQNATHLRANTGIQSYLVCLS